MLSLWQGTCSNMVNIACSVNCGISPQACLEFTTDGTNTYYVVAEGTQGGFGKLKFQLDDH